MYMVDICMSINGKVKDPFTKCVKKPNKQKDSIFGFIHSFNMYICRYLFFMVKCKT